MFRNDNIRDELIWNKLVKRELFLNISKIMEKYIDGKKWNHHEDFIWSLLIHKYGTSMKCLNKYIYMYEKNSESITKNSGTQLELENMLNTHEMFGQIFEKNHEIYFYRTISNLINFIQSNELFSNLVKTNIEIKYRVIKICSNFINRVESKDLNYHKIFSFLYHITK